MLPSSWLHAVAPSLVLIASATGCARGPAAPAPQHALAAAPERSPRGSSSGDEGVATPLRDAFVQRATPAAQQPRAVQANGRNLAALEPSGPRLEGFARIDQVQSLVRRSGVAAACWNDAVAHLPSHRPERVRAELAVDGYGRARVEVYGAEDPRLARCLRLRLASVPYGEGGASTIETTWSFARNE